MKVLNLGCSLGHTFEGWFGSELDFQDQLQRNLLSCPLCADEQITKLPSAPRLNLLASSSGSSGTTTAPAPLQPSALGVSSPQPNSVPNANSVSPLDPQVQAAMISVLRQMVSQTEDVGRSFPEQARRMHHGEVEPKAIRGEATLDEARALAEEGIAVLPLPPLPFLKGTLQ
jgi:hypothetical protein